MASVVGGTCGCISLDVKEPVIAQSYTATCMLFKCAMMLLPIIVY